MIKTIIALVVVGILIFLGYSLISEKEVDFGNMEIKSVFGNGERIPVKYTADGENVNPRVEVLTDPENGQSLVLIVDDPDAPSGDWVHWVVWNIPVGDVDENSVPSGAVQGLNDFGIHEYKGPSPPAGTGEHHYHFKIYALDMFLDIDENSKKSDVLKAIEGHVLSMGEVVGVYSR